MFGCGPINNKIVGGIKRAMELSSRLQQNEVLCNECNGEGLFYRFSNKQKWLYEQDKPKPEIETFNCDKCKGIGAIKHVNTF